MMAILLARHVDGSSNSERQWSAAEISEELKNLPYGATINFHIDPDALQHGMSKLEVELNLLFIIM